MSIEHGEQPLASTFVERKEPLVEITARCVCGAECSVRSSYASPVLEEFIRLWRKAHESCKEKA